MGAGIKILQQPLLFQLSTNLHVEKVQLIHRSSFLEEFCDHKVDYVQDTMFCNSSKETHPCTTQREKKGGKGRKKN